MLMSATARSDRGRRFLRSVHRPAQSRTRPIVALAIFLITGCAGPVGVRAAGAPRPLLRLELSAPAGQLDLAYDGRSMATYDFRAAPQRPCVSRLLSLQGDGLLYGATPETPHTRGLSLAFTVNGTSFSEVETNAGWQRPGAELSRRILRDAQDRAVAEIEHRVYWLPSKESPANADAALLIEDRLLRFTVDEGASELALEWDSRCTPGPSWDAVFLTATPGQGLALRLALEFSESGTAVPTHPGTAPSTWMSRRARFGNHWVVVSLFDDPDGSAPTRFDTLLQPHPILVSSGGLTETPQLLRAGEVFRVHGLLTVHTHSVTLEALAERRAQWLQDRGGR